MVIMEGLKYVMIRLMVGPRASPRVKTFPIDGITSFIGGAHRRPKMASL